MMLNFMIPLVISGAHGVQDSFFCNYGMFHRFKCFTDYGIRLCHHQRIHIYFFNCVECIVGHFFFHAHDCLADRVIIQFNSSNVDCLYHSFPSITNKPAFCKPF